MGALRGSVSSVLTCLFADNRSRVVLSGQNDYINASYVDVSG